MDLLPTFARLAGTAKPADRVIDGHDIWPLLSAAEGTKTPYAAFYYYQIDQLQAVRSGKWKLHLPLAEKKRNWREPFKNVPLQLYDLEADVSESTDVSTDHPKVVDRLLALAERACEDIGDVGREGKNQRPAGFVDNPKPVLL
jgi:arylsulfatase A-like enzyme